MQENRITDVIVISQVPPPVHGSTLMTQTFLRTLDSLGFSWFLVDRRFSRSVEQVGRFGFGKVFAAVGLWFRLAAAIMNRRPKVVVFFATTRKFSFLVDWALSELLRLTRVKTVLYLHTIGYSELAQQGRMWPWLVLRLFGSAFEVVVLDDSLAWDVRPFTSAPITAIPNTLPELPQPADKSIPIEDRTVILFLSNLIEGKGYDDFVEVAIRALNQGVNAEFVLAGDASDEVAAAVQQRIDASGHQRDIRMVGAVKSAEKWQLLHSAKMLIFPSKYKYEAFPLVLLEAAACGVSIVSYRTSALAPILAQQQGAIAVEGGDLDSIFSGCYEISRDGVKLRKMSQSNQVTYATLFSREKFAAKWQLMLTPWCDEAV